MRLNTYSKNADSAYRDYRPSQSCSPSQSHPLSGFSISLPVSNSWNYITQYKSGGIVKVLFRRRRAGQSFRVRILSRGICFKPLKWGMTFCWAASSVVFTPRAVEEFDVSRHSYWTFCKSDRVQVSAAWVFSLSFFVWIYRCTHVILGAYQCSFIYRERVMLRSRDQLNTKRFICME